MGLSVICIILIKGDRKERKEDCKEKIRKNRNCTFPNPEGPVDRL
jgi:hypothetical protein